MEVFFYLSLISAFFNARFIWPNYYVLRGITANIFTKLGNSRANHSYFKVKKFDIKTLKCNIFRKEDCIIFFDNSVIGSLV